MLSKVFADYFQKTQTKNPVMMTFLVKLQAKPVIFPKKVSITCIFLWILQILQSSYSVEKLGMVASDYTYFNLNKEDSMIRME